MACSYQPSTCTGLIAWYTFHRQELIEQCALIALNLRILRAEEEPCRVQCLSIKVREVFVYLLLHGRILLRACAFLNWKQHMELRPCQSAVLGLHVGTGEVDNHLHTPEGVSQILRRQPVGRVIRVVVVNIKGQAIGTNKVRSIAVIAFIFRTYIIMGKGFFQSLITEVRQPVGIPAVLRVVSGICVINCKHRILLKKKY